MKFDLLKTLTGSLVGNKWWRSADILRTANSTLKVTTINCTALLRTSKSTDMIPSSIAAFDDFSEEIHRSTVGLNCNCCEKKTDDEQNPKCKKVVNDSVNEVKLRNEVHAKLWGYYFADIYDNGIERLLYSVLSEIYQLVRANGFSMRNN